MLDCLRLAQKGAGHVSPNPMVGAILAKNGKVIGRGYHRSFGGPHAEVYALDQAGKKSRGATLYVNLEPCSYHGKTPPCTERIIAAGIDRVVIGMKDPNPLIDGRGIRELRRAGISVTVNVLKQESTKLNEAFRKYITTGLPFVTLKVAQSIDGKIADATGKSRWITNELSRTLGHALRSRSDAVIVGANTVQTDDPYLTVRHMKGKNPLRVVIDGKLRLRSSMNVFRNQRAAPTLLFITNRSYHRKKKRVEELVRRGVHVVVMPEKTRRRMDFQEILHVLGRKGIASVLVEGGSEVFSTFIRDRLADKIVVFVSPRIIGKGLSAFDHVQNSLLQSPVKLTDITTWNLHEDLMLEGYLRKS
jgi:diaminohydroxyphosphoribosylaminopyrimidine deaminase/5-amino-6-(5-phosphoribosylamino)uracil reductase